MAIKVQFYNIAPEGAILQPRVYIRDSLMVRMSACRVLDRGSIPRRGVVLSSFSNLLLFKRVKFYLLRN